VVRGVMSSHHEPTAEEGNQIVSKTITEMQEKAKTRPGARTSSEAVAATANEMSAQQLSSAPESKRPTLAAAQFVGYYYVNGTVMPDVCRAQGVDIGGFASAFRNEHTSEHARATSLIQAAGYSEQQITNSLAANQAQMHGVIEQTLRDMASRAGKSSIKDGCTLISEHGDVIANALKASAANPIMWKALMAQG
jgi:hypothetical protein